ncbi:MAG: M14 family zinc carboxypeptidase [Longimicrobiales bacterium]
MRKQFPVTAALAVASALLLGGTALDAQQLPQTFQEQQNFRSGPTMFEPLMVFWHELDAVSDLVSMQPLTRTLLDRPMPLIIIAEPMVASPEDAIRSGKAIVLVTPAVHGGETASKEAFQLVAKELVGGPMRALLKDVIVIGLPAFNPDGGEVRRRTNEAGYDMNRDYLKLESQEIHALVTQVLNRWTPDIHIDGHHGGAVPNVITYQGTLNPAADAELRAYPYQHIFPMIREAIRAEDYVTFDYSGPTTRGGVQGWGATSVEPRKHHVYTGLVNVIGILLETPGGSVRVMRDGTLKAIPQEERYQHQVRGQFIAQKTIIRAAAEQRTAIRALTTASRMRAIQAGATGGDPIVLDYELVNRGNETIWMPDSTASLGYAQKNVPIWLKYNATRTTPRPVGYLLPPSMASVLPLLLDHDIAVYRFMAPTTLDAEVYYATKVRQDSYFQGHYLKSVEVEKKAEKVEAVAGWYWIPTAQSRGNLISYLFEPETDDNLITWGYADHLLEVRPETVQEAMQAMAEDMDLSSLTAEQRARYQQRAEQMLASPQRVPMMRVTTHQKLPVMRVAPFNQFQRTRYSQPY